MSGKAYTPREYVEHQLHMSDEEKEARKVFFEELFSDHNAKSKELSESA